MALNLIYRLLERDRTRTLDERVRENRRRQEHTAERQERREKQESEDAVDFVLIAEATRQAVEELSRNIDDAMQAVRLAYERTQIEHNAALEALDTARENAITLADGRRVYFSADGATLFAEDHQAITDETAIAEARQSLTEQPEATRFETYTESEDRFRAVTESLERLGDTLNRLDDIHRRLENGEVDEQELAELTEQAQQIIEALPPRIREDYEGLRAARIGGRNLAYRQLDPDAEKAFGDRSDFETTQTAVSVGPDHSEEHEEEADTNRAPAYRSAPEF